MDVNIISTATEKNWERLNTNIDGRLVSRANKYKSSRKIYPDKYIKLPGLTAMADELSDSTARVKDIIYSLCVKKIFAQLHAKNANVTKFLSEYKDCKEISYTTIPDHILNDKDNDWIGYIYQSLLQEGERNAKGIYYTNYSIVQDMVSAIDLSKGQSFLDPCCGSGAFLLNVNKASLTQLYGVDNDAIAVMIAKANLISKYPDETSYPQIYCMDYLKDDIHDNPVLNISFDYIYTNPPWGTARSEKYASRTIHSNERSSLFLVKAFKQLKDKGELKFILPSSILKIKSHKDIRHFILKEAHIEEISMCNEKFNGVFTDFFSIALTKRKTDEQEYRIIRNGQASLAKTQSCNADCAILLSDSDESHILEQIEKERYDTLIHSTWALGIVTGDNKNKIKKEPFEDSEIIYTGKDISKYKLAEASHYILYDRSSLQQCAKDEIYRAPEKLVYKFISKRLCFALDNSRSLFLNSANILIPDIKGMSAKTVMAFLNSEIFSFYYSKKFPDVKILKGNLAVLPFPAITADQDATITRMVETCTTDYSAIDDYIYGIYKFDETIIKQIKHFISCS